MTRRAARSPGRTSAGLVLVRRSGAGHEVLLAHPGGPFWAKKDAGAWSITKGLVEDGEDELAAAIRETREELGLDAARPPFVPLGDTQLRSGKRVVAWAATAEVDPAMVESNEITIEWPPRTGRTIRIPEIDRVIWCELERARTLANPALVVLLERALAPGTLAALGL